MTEGYCEGRWRSCRRVCERSDAIVHRSDHEALNTPRLTNIQLTRVISAVSCSHSLVSLCLVASSGNRTQKSTANSLKYSAISGCISALSLSIFFFKRTCSSVRPLPKYSKSRLSPCIYSKARHFFPCLTTPVDRLLVSCLVIRGVSYIYI